MRFFLGCVLAGAIGALGCGGGDKPPPTTTGPVSDVTGTLMDVHVTETGDVSNMRAPTQFEIAAVFPGDDGTPREILAIIGKDGNFRIPKVPEVPFDLRYIEFYGSGTLPPRYIMNAPRNIDLGRVYVGRPDAESINTSPAEIILNVSDLEPWTDGDALELFSLGAGAAGELDPTNGTLPAAGSTSLTNYAVDTATLTAPKLVNGEKGDKASITQLAGIAGVNAPYRSVRKVFDAPSYTQPDGTSVALSGAFVDVPQKEFSVEMPTPAFLALAKVVHPSASVAGKNVRIIAEPGGDRATASFTPNLMICETLPNYIFPPSFSYGNPFPSAWAEVVSADVSFTMTHVAPSGIPKSVAVFIGQSGPANSFTSPVAPKLGPPTNLTINDTPAQDTVLGTGFSPTVKFEPPTIGTPAVYIVAIRRLDPGGGTTRTTALFSTTETTLRIPEGLLDFGYYYYIRVTVRGEFNVAQPLKSTPSSTYASALTGVFSP